jgi:hypothetical protein
LRVAIQKLSTHPREKNFSPRIRAILKEKTHLRVSSAQVRVDLSTSKRTHHEKEKEGEEKAPLALPRTTPPQKAGSFLFCSKIRAFAVGCADDGFLECYNRR